jgi:hypothetical protein
MPACPSSTENGCRCPEHHPGLLEFTIDDQHRATLKAILEPLREKPAPTLVVLDGDEIPHDPRSYTCECKACRQEIADRMAAASPRAFRSAA